jgi:hypothetical protein
MRKTMQSADQKGYPETDVVDGADRSSSDGEPGLDAPRRFLEGAEWWRVRRELRRKQRSERRQRTRRRRQERRAASRQRRELKSLQRQLVGRRRRRFRPAPSLPPAGPEPDRTELNALVGTAVASALEKDRARFREDVEKRFDGRLRAVTRKFARWQQDSEERLRVVESSVEESTAEIREKVSQLERSAARGPRRRG